MAQEHVSCLPGHQKCRRKYHVGDVICRLGEFGITSRAQAFVPRFLGARCIHLVRFLSEKLLLPISLHQGRVLGRLLFSLVLSDIVSLLVYLSREIEMTVFAEDICL